MLTFLPAWRRAKASSVEMVLFPTPPFPERTRMMCWTPARFPASSRKGGGQRTSAPGALQGSLTEGSPSTSHGPDSETCPLTLTSANTPGGRSSSRPAPDLTLGFSECCHRSPRLQPGCWGGTDRPRAAPLHCTPVSSLTRGPHVVDEPRRCWLPADSRGKQANMEDDGGSARRDRWQVPLCWGGPTPAPRTDLWVPSVLFSGRTLLAPGTGTASLGPVLKPHVR